MSKPARRWLMVHVFVPLSHAQPAALASSRMDAMWNGMHSLDARERNSPPMDPPGNVGVSPARLIHPLFLVMAPEGTELFRCEVLSDVEEQSKPPLCGRMPPGLKRSRPELCRIHVRSASGPCATLTCDLEVAPRYVKHRPLGHGESLGLLSTLDGGDSRHVVGHRVRRLVDTLRHFASRQ